MLRVLTITRKWVWTNETKFSLHTSDIDGTLLSGLSGTDQTAFTRIRVCANLLIVTTSRIPMAVAANF